MVTVCIVMGCTFPPARRTMSSSSEAHALLRSPNFPTLSTGGAPHTNVPVDGSKTRGRRCSSRGGRTPRRGLDAGDDVGGGGSDAGVDKPASADETSAASDTLAPFPAALVAPSSAVLWRPEPAMSARASSSTSSKASCLTAPIEYAHTPTENAASAAPVRALRSRKGSRARRRPGDITWQGIVV